MIHNVQFQSFRQRSSEASYGDSTAGQQFAAKVADTISDSSQQASLLASTALHLPGFVASERYLIQSLFKSKIGILLNKWFDQVLKFLTVLTYPVKRKKRRSYTVGINLRRSCMLFLLLFRYFLTTLLANNSDFESASDCHESCLCIASLANQP